jgi:hypothetical protein
MESEDILAQAEEIHKTPTELEPELSSESPSEVSSSTLDEISSELPPTPVKERPPEATLVEIVPAPPAPPPAALPEEVHEIPDWLKPLPKTTQHIDKAVVEPKIEIPQKETIVTTDISSVVSDPNGKKDDAVTSSDFAVEKEESSEPF